jgi:hypothetical protein
MRFHRLFLGFTFVALLLPVGTAWGGAGILEANPLALLADRECSLLHVCQGGARAGQRCTTTLTPTGQGM